MGHVPRVFTAKDLTPDVVTYMRLGIELAKDEGQLSAKAQLAAAPARCRPADAIASATHSVFQALQHAHSLRRSKGVQRQPNILHAALGPALGTPAASQDASSNSMPQMGSDGAPRGSGQHWLLDAGYLPLSEPSCRLFARKFPADLQEELLGLALSCAGLGLGAECT